MYNQEVRQQDFYIGSVRINGKTEWSTLDTDISTAFRVRARSVAYTFLNLCKDNLVCSNTILACK